MNEMKNKKHHTMETIPKWPEKNTTLWEQFQNEKKITTIWKQFHNGHKKIPQYGTKGYIRVKRRSGLINNKSNSINRQGQSSQVWVGKESDPDTKIIRTNNIGRGRAQGYSSKQYIQIRK
jgi:predicted DNA-binding helix-hairpin-helix protein